MLPTKSRLNMSASKSKEINFTQDSDELNLSHENSSLDMDRALPKLHDAQKGILEEDQ